MSDRSILVDGLAQLGIAHDVAQADALISYLALLIKWNKTYNLISRKEVDNLIALHLLDSLAVLPYIDRPRVIDVGSGAGLPGMPLAIMLPQTQLELLDSNGKKARFRTQATMELGLKNVTVVNQRAEAYQPPSGFDIVISRAFATIADMLKVAGHLVAADGCFLAMKGIYPEQELAELPAGFECEGVHALSVPGLNAERHLVVIKRSTES